MSSFPCKQLTTTLTLISKDKVLDKSTGNIVSLYDNNTIAQIENYLNENYSIVDDIEQNVDVVLSVDTKIINLQLQTSDGLIDTKNRILNRGISKW
jgi:hypothetical protein